MTEGLLASLKEFPLLLTSAETTSDSLGKVLNAWTQVRRRSEGGPGTVFEAQMGHSLGKIPG